MILIPNDNLNRQPLNEFFVDQTWYFEMTSGRQISLADALHFDSKVLRFFIVWQCFSSGKNKTLATSIHSLDKSTVVAEVGFLNQLGPQSYMSIILTISLAFIA